MRRFGLALTPFLILAPPALALDAGDRTFQAGRVGARRPALKTLGVTVSSIVIAFGR